MAMGVRPAEKPQIRPLKPSPLVRDTAVTGPAALSGRTTKDRALFRNLLVCCMNYLHTSSGIGQHRPARSAPHFFFLGASTMII